MTKFNISRLALKYKWLTVNFWVVVAVAGILAFTSLKYELFPNVTFPVVIVNAKASIVSLLDTETHLTKPLERSLQSLSGLDDLSSTIYQGQTTVTAFFFTEISLEEAKKRVETAVKGVALPKEGSYEVIPFNLNESMAISYAIESEKLSLDELQIIVIDKIVPQISQLEGVLKVNLLGDTDNDSKNSDYATLVRFNGENALALQIIKGSGANTLEVVKRVQEKIDRLQPQLNDLKITLAETKANYIRSAIQATIDDLLAAIAIAILVIYPFLRNWKATFISALAIPLSLLGTFIVMAIFGFNLETITLLALGLTIGNIIDDAIVDVENISRHIDNGQSPQKAAIEATDEIGLTVSASTLTNVAVFLPVALMGGTIGQFFKPFGLTVSAAILISLLIARTLCPVLAVLWLESKGGDLEKNRQEDKKPITKSQLIYRNLLNRSLSHRKTVAIIALISFIAGIALIPYLPKGFIPRLDRGELNIVYTTPLPKISLKSTSKSTPKPTTQPSQGESKGNFDWLTSLAVSPERILLRKTREIGIKLEDSIKTMPEIVSTFTIAGVQGIPNQGKIYIKLKENIDLSTAEVQAKIRTLLPKIMGVSTSVEDIPFIDTGSEKPLKISSIGDNLDSLKQTAINIEKEIAKLPELTDISTSIVTNKKRELIQIQHLNGKRVIYITANLNRGYAIGDATNRVLNIAHSLLPKDITLDRSGNSEQSNDVINSFVGTLGLSVICILAVLLLQFGGFIEPIAIALSLPLSIIGAMLALLITQSELGAISAIGIIFLIGIVNKNAILLIDYARQLRQKGWSRHEALLETGVVRFRPILMTTSANILGMIPLALNLGAGAELRQPMAVAIIGGMVTSSLLSLIVVPVFYTLLEDIWIRFKANKNIKI
jgi:multidrug efflux pump subunit AcrB